MVKSFSSIFTLFIWNDFILLYLLTVGGDAGAGWRSQLWAEPKAKGTRSTNPTETEKGEQEEEIESVCVSDKLTNDGFTALEEDIVPFSRYIIWFEFGVCHVFQNSMLCMYHCFSVIFGVIFYANFKYICMNKLTTIFTACLFLLW